MTLIELMIVVAILAVIMALALPVYSNYAIRTKISKALDVAHAAGTAVSSVCGSQRTDAGLEIALADYRFSATKLDRSFVASIDTAGSCAGPTIIITTRNTGVSPDPVLTLSGKIGIRSNQIAWYCLSSNIAAWLLPKSCQS